ncbi:glutamate 5-kinase [Carnimonas nigrificans]|uniref:glutamate 5-kinase n=1 Tax=Carnimonas nigrificans TaxID=64323 RepID=UPI000470EAA3|nr:glutamate 5-kinase [Carnimonas nigrificans]
MARQVLERADLANVKCVVVKIGSALLTNDGRGLNREGIAQWVEQLVELRRRGILPVVVSSGAVAEGMTRLGWRERPTELDHLQAAAAVGQSGLVQCWEDHFASHGVLSAQILLTHDDLADRRRYLNAQARLKTLIGLGVVPVINENDTVANDEINFGDNDTLGALVTNLVEAEVLVLLTDQEGLFDDNPRENPDAKLIPEADAGDRTLDAMAGDGGALGRGGMATKVKASRVAARSGAVTVIASGRQPNVVLRVIDGEMLGTLLKPEGGGVTARKRWLLGQVKVRGTLVLDDGAVARLRDEGSSLLPVGVKQVAGDFNRGDIVLCVNGQGDAVAKGITNYGSQDTKRILGMPSRAIEPILGFCHSPDLIHRDNLVMV